MYALFPGKDITFTTFLMSEYFGRMIFPKFLFYTFEHTILSSVGCINITGYACDFDKSKSIK